MSFDHGLSPGQVIDNRELMDIFGCSNSGGMRRSNKTDSLVIVSDHSKSIYEDRQIDGIVHYTGMGMKGDQSLTFAQNRTLAESATNGVDLLFSEVLQRGRYTFIGKVQLAGTPYQEVQPDINNNPRNVWMFPLGIIGNRAPVIPLKAILEKNAKKEREARKLSDEELIRRAQYSKKFAGRRRVETEISIETPM